MILWCRSRAGRAHSGDLTLRLDIGEQGKPDSAVGPGAMAPSAVDGHPEDPGAESLEVREHLVEDRALGTALGAPIRGIEHENHGAPRSSRSANRVPSVATSSKSGACTPWTRASMISSRTVVTLERTCEDARATGAGRLCFGVGDT